MKLINVGMLLGGTLIGFAGGFFFGKKITEKRADVEMKSVIKTFNDTIVNMGSKEVKEITDDVYNKDIKVNAESQNVISNDSIDYNKLKGNEESYFNYHNRYVNTNTTTMPKKNFVKGPYIISSEEFAQSVFNVQSLIYWKDGILTDDDWNVINDIKGTIGNDTFSSISNYETDDVIYVRDTEKEIDYEIYIDYRNFEGNN